jgi:1,4-dihydroxy-2-naphthoate octaprenyltransferase
VKNPIVFYAAIALGVIAVIVGVLYTAGIIPGHHAARGYAGLGVGAVLVIAGLVGMFVLKPKAAIK